MSANLLERATPEWKLIYTPEGYAEIVEPDNLCRVIGRFYAADAEGNANAELIALAPDHALAIRALRLGRAHFSGVGALVVLTAPAARPLVFDFDEDAPLTPDLREALRRAIGIEAANGQPV